MRKHCSLDAQINDKTREERSQLAPLLLGSSLIGPVRFVTVPGRSKKQAAWTTNKRNRQPSIDPVISQIPSKIR